MNDCLFCKIVAGDIPADKVYEDEQILVFKDINPQADVHLLMIPKLHVASLNELDKGHDEVIAQMLRRLPQVAQQQGLDDGFRTIINTGKGGGQIVFHLHMHLLGSKNRSLPGFG